MKDRFVTVEKLTMMDDSELKDMEFQKADDRGGFKVIEFATKGTLGSER